MRSTFDRCWLRTWPLQVVVKVKVKLVQVWGCLEPSIFVHAVFVIKAMNAISIITSCTQIQSKSMD